MISECQERIQWMVEGLEEVQHITDNVIVHSRDQEQDKRLEALLERLEENGITLRR